MILNSPYVSGSLTVTGNITALGGISISGSIASASYAANAELLDGLDSSVFVLSSSFQNYSSSNDGKVAALNTFSASILSYTSSTDARIAQLNRETASLNLATASLNNATASLYNTTASLNAAVSDIRNATASLYNATASLYAATSSIYNFTSSANLRIGSLEQYTQSLNTRSASFACVTATNNFGCAQYFSNVSNAISFTSTGSLYSDGGMRITKDMYVSGTAYFNNVTVFGTQSINYITSSQLNIASNLITVNTSTPAVRFGGLAVYDSGSLGTGLTGSILWDSENNHWVYSNPSGSSYSGGMFISGPRSAALGSEQGTTACALMIGQGGDHITSSGIFHYGNATCFYGNATIQSTGAACFASNVCINDKVVILDPTDGSATALFIGTKDGAMTVGQQVRLDFSQITTPLARIAGEYTGGTFSSALAFSTNATCTETLTEQLRIDCNGIACFRNTVCSPAFVGGTVSGTTGTFSGKICANTAGTVTSGFADGLNLGSWDAVGYTSAGTDLVLGG